MLPDGSENDHDRSSLKRSLSPTSGGLTIPAVSSLMAKWFPTPEKGVLSSITMSGFPGGAVLGGLLIGTLCNCEFLGGWPLVFYSFGLMGIFLSFFVYLYGFNSPDDDCCISESEYKYIMSNLDSLDTDMKYKTPWKAIATSISTWAAVFGMFGQYWITYFYLSVQPNFLGNALRFSHMESGYVNSLPYIGQMLVTWASSFFSDYLVNKGYSSTDIVRKVCNTLTGSVPVRAVLIFSPKAKGIEQIGKSGVKPGNALLAFRP
ncbi:Sodium-dependent phosphate transport protein 1 [Araneus ventricosus]|uniref:Sodium-dependent phosphate transport protein 1 n=1 Tax=Araneus ventricosus TaxID=182803 RepID=A0A4Y2M568_ARAVE|nr:Sodium-dependent phosphate transport protein 1 [Araneus ventricosus]